MSDGGWSEARASAMTSLLLSTQVALASWTATGCKSIPMMFCWSLSRVSVGGLPCWASMMLRTRHSMKVPDPQAGSMVTALVGWSMSSSAMVCASHRGV